jgi:hypothetical protein
LPYDVLRNEIEAVARLEDAKEIADRMAGYEAYFRAAREREAERAAAELHIRAARRAGQLLAEMEMLRGRPEKASSATRLSALGITYDQSSRWQRLARSYEDQFERALALAGLPTITGVLLACSPPPPVIEATADQAAPALWVVGADDKRPIPTTPRPAERPAPSPVALGLQLSSRQKRLAFRLVNILLDFESDRLLAEDPNALFAAADHKDEIARLAPQIHNWLGKLRVLGDRPGLRLVSNKTPDGPTSSE